MPTRDEVDRIWSRALGPADAAEREGDAALRAVLAFHNMAMNGGVLHAIQRTPAGELESAREAYRLYGFTTIAGMIATPVDEDADPDDLDDVEEELDDVYGDAIPNDETLRRAVEAHVHLASDAYAPV